MKRKVILLVIITLLSSSISGCYDRRPIDNLALVAATGIDQAKDKDKIRLTVQIIKPSVIKGESGSGGTKGQSVWVLSTTGYTVLEAVRKFTEQVGRNLFWAHNMIIVFGEDLARQGVNEYIDFFNRNPELRKRSWILISKGVDAKEILEAKFDLESIPASAIDLLVKSEKDNAKVRAVDLQEFSKLLVNPQVSPTAARIELVAKDDLRKKEKKAKETGAKEPPKRVRANGAAIFKEDRLVTWFGEKEVRGLLWVLGEVKNSIVVISCPDDKDKKISLEVTQANSKITPRFVDGEPVINIKIKEEGNLGDQMCKENLVTLEGIEMLERRQAAVIRNEIRLALKQAQEVNSDIFRFAQVIHRSFPQKWKKIKGDWDEIFPRLQVNVEVDSEIRRIGLVKRANEAK
ncbi:Ger(x)C family spore germination protein [Candidatus Frackibacter sp. WG13]|uniref:Ger(x)C family spore germination protein n=1 Tax=Candidatus Frackibacter sp. WG13 TaxID=2017978 RepID=UPI0008E4745E|nr:Ger(x)C family spore germination protein [Candidatus Frackibacter sp. WG13]SFL52137.1 spore germination protein KC [Candidatus Frackibacter sp. WG13]